MSELRRFRIRVERLRDRLFQAEKEGELTTDMASVARDAILSWASGRTAQGWLRDTKTDEKQREILVSTGVWPWEEGETWEA